MTPLNRQAWDWLQRELDTWAESGLQATFWWRDDDAVAAGDALSRLVSLGAERQVPLALAVIPKQAEKNLAQLVEQAPLISITQHGYAHKNFAAAGQRSLELGGERGSDKILAELEQGFQFLREQFGARFLPVLVPPWNRIDPAIVGRLAGIGFRGISMTRARREAHPAPGILQVNVHLDPIHWRHQGGFIGVYPAIAILVQHLRARRTGYRDLAEPTGILTHHLVQNDAVWRFVTDLIVFVDRHPAVCWLDAREIWSNRVAVI